MNEKMKMFSIKNIILISKTISNNEKQYKSRALPRSLCHSALEFRAFVRTPPDTFISEPFVLKMIGCRSRADVATLQRRDVETSQGFYLLTSALLTQRRDAGTSRRGDVATWRRRDVGTSRRDSHFHALLFIAPKTASNSCSFRSNVLVSKTDTKSGV